MPEEKLIDVLLLTKNDWANTGYRFWKCLKSLGLNCIMFKGNQHSFEYPNQAPIHPSLSGLPIDFYPVTLMAPYFETLFNQTKVVHLLASTFILTPGWVWKKKETKVVVQHGGSTYRLNPDRCNQVFNPISDATIIQCPDLLGLGAKNEVLIYYPVDTQAIKPSFNFRYPERYVVGHFPSDPAVKGTKDILPVIKQVIDENSDSKLLYQGIDNVEGTKHWVPWQENLERMAACDIIIETMNPSIAGKKFGEWGNTALEAAAMGKIVITNCHSLDTYRAEYGNNPALHIANTPEQLANCLKDLSQMSPAQIIKRKQEARDWAERYHSIDATAERLWSKVYSKLLL